MATRAEDLTPGAEPEDDNELPPEDDGQQPPEGSEPGEPEGEGGEPPAPDPVEALAIEMGWTPKDKFNGPADQWKSAADFIKTGREIQRGYANELRGLRSQIDVMARTTADIVQDRLQQQREELTARYNELVEEGDAAGAFKVSQQIVGLENRARAPQPVAPSPEGEEFAQRHAHWLGKDAAATARAVQITNDLAAQGVPAADQLKAAERILKLEYPEYFAEQRNGQQAPVVNRPGGRSPAPSNRAKGFSDLPKAAQDVAIDMEKRGVIPSRDAYAKNYWKNAEGTR